MSVKERSSQILANMTRRKWLIGAGLCCGVLFLIGISIFSYYWSKVGHLVDDRLKHPLFTETARIYAAPAEIRPGQKLTPPEEGRELQQAGYWGGGGGIAPHWGPRGPTSEAVRP